MDKEEAYVKDWLSRPYCAAGLNKPAFEVKEFSKKEKKGSKTPDFRVYSEGRLAFFCEVKGISQNVPSGVHADSIYNRITTKIHEAVQQFEAVNPTGAESNALAFVTDDDFWDEDDLIQTMKGTFDADNGSCDRIYIKYSQGRIKDEKYRIHLYIWMRAVFHRNQPRTYLLFSEDEHHYKALCQLFCVDPGGVKLV